MWSEEEIDADRADALAERNRARVALEEADACVRREVWGAVQYDPGCECQTAVIGMLHPGLGPNTRLFRPCGECPECVASGLTHDDIAADDHLSQPRRHATAAEEALYRRYEVEQDSDGAWRSDAQPE